MEKSLKGKRWTLKECDQEQADRLSQEMKISPILARLLVIRGLSDSEQVQRFLNPSLADLVEPGMFREMDLAVDRLMQARTHKERILIHGDYDVDGIAASALMVEYLRLREWEADVILPNRFDEGYGLSDEVVQQAAEDGYSLILTVDCGITASKEIELAKSLGLDVIVTDHHEASNNGRPEMAVAVIDSKVQDSGYPHDMLSGTGVAYKLVEALEIQLRDQGFPSVDLKQWHDLVALGTIADIVPLLGENRILVRSGLEQLKVTRRPGLRALMDRANVVQEKIGVWTVSFIIAPRLNAAGRTGDPRTSLDILLTPDYQEAMELAGILEETNQFRKSLVEEVGRDCNRMLKDNPELLDDGVLLLAKKDWPKGVLGIVASRLLESFYRPTILLTIEDGVAHGSGRSIPGFNLVDCLSQCGDLFTSFGGHEGAAGLNFSEDNLDELRVRLRKVADEMLKDQDLSAYIDVDAEIPIEDLSNELIEDLEQLAPFGEKNRSPVFVSRNIDITGRMQIFGNNHLKFLLGEPGRIIEALAFSQGKILDKVDSNHLDFVYTMRKGTFRGEERIEMMLKDIGVSAPVQSARAGIAPARRVLDWREKDSLIEAFLEEVGKHNDQFVFAIDYDDPKREQLLQVLGEKSVEVEQSDCLVEAIHHVHRNSTRFAIAPVWRRPDVRLSLAEEECRPLRVIMLSFPGGAISGIHPLLDDVREHGSDLWLYLAFGKDEREAKTQQIQESYPDRDFLAKIYRLIQMSAVNGQIHLPQALTAWAKKGFSSVAIQSALLIFEELSLLQQLNQGETLELLPAETKRSLEYSETYKHGQQQRQIFETWAKWVMQSPAPEVASKL